MCLYKFIYPHPPFYRFFLGNTNHTKSANYPIPFSHPLIWERYNQPSVLLRPFVLLRKFGIEIDLVSKRYNGETASPLLVRLFFEPFRWSFHPPFYRSFPSCINHIKFANYLIPFFRPSILERYGQHVILLRPFVLLRKFGIEIDLVSKRHNGETASPLLVQLFFELSHWSFHPQ